MFPKCVMMTTRFYISYLRVLRTSAIPAEYSYNFTRIRSIHSSYLLQKVKSKQGKMKKLPTYTQLDIPPEIGEEICLSEFEAECAKILEVLQHKLTKRIITKVTAMDLDSLQVPTREGFIPLKMISQLSFPKPNMIRLDMRYSMEHLHRALSTLKEYFPFAAIQTHGNDTIDITTLRTDKEMRLDMTREAKKISQELKYSLRNKGTPVLKKVKADKSLSEDLVYTIENHLQSVTKYYADAIDQFTEKKEKEIDSMN